MTIVYLNGNFIPKERAMVPVEDRGFIFGDAIYEGVRAVQGQLFEWDAHAARMVRGLAGLRIPFGAADVAALKEVHERLLRENGLTDGEAFLYSEVSRGTAARTHHFPSASTVPTVLVMANKLTVSRPQREAGVKAVTHPDLRWKRRDWKTVNLLGNVIARQAAAEAGAYEAILHEDGIVTEGAATNVFAVLDGVIRTHPLNERVLPGITRRVIVELIHELGLALDETPIPFSALASAQEIFLCGSTTDVTPVVTLDAKPVGDGQPGQITVKLRDAFEARLYQAAGSAR